MHYIYQFLNDKSEVIYVGITNRLYKRLRSEHFTDAGHLSERCYEEVENIRYSECLNHDDARIKERYLINRLNPKYNNEMRNKSAFNFVIDDFQWVDFVSKKQLALKPEEKAEESLALPTEDFSNYIGIPSVIARSALFPISKTYYEPGPGAMAQVPSVRSYLVEQAFGESFQTVDGKVFTALLNLATPTLKANKNRKIAITRYTLARAAGLGVSKCTYELIDESLERLHTIRVRFSLRDALVNEAVSCYLTSSIRQIRDPVTDRLLYEIEMGHLDELLTKTVLWEMTWYSKDVIGFLDKKPLAFKLYQIFCSNKTMSSNDRAYRWSLSHLKAITGATCSSREFKRLMKTALEFLKQNQIILFYDIQEGNKETVFKVNPAPKSVITKINSGNSGTFAK